MVGINSNLAASSATRNLGSANTVVSSSIAKLSSGNRIIKASDDVAGLAIGTSIRSTVKTLEISLLNTQQAGSVLSIADGALQQIGDILARQKSLATQANSGSLGSAERGYLNQEFTALTSEIDRIVGSTQFNGIVLLNGSLGSASGKALNTAPTITAAYDVIGETTGSDGLNAALNAASFGGTFDPELVGSLADANFSITSIAANSITATLQIGDKTFTGADANTNSGANDIVLTEISSGLTITIQLAQQGVADQTAANTLANGVEADLRTATIFQTRTFGTTTTGLPTTNTQGTVLAGVGGADVNIKSSTINSNNAPTVGAFSVSAATSTTDFSVTTTVGGVSYSTTSTTNGVVDGVNGAALDTRDLDDAGGATGVLRLYRGGDATANPNDFIEIDIATNSILTNIDVSSEENATAFESALNSLFGVGNNGALSFQVGANVSDAIAVSITSVLTTDIFKNDAGTAVSLDITSQTNAQTAIDVLDNAIASVIARRADVGAAQSRFNFAASNLETSIANQDAARGSFLDADIATESTNFASAQVRLQASTSVLAQANSLPRDLLRLLQ
jgi:flagellin